MHQTKSIEQVEPDWLAVFKAQVESLRFGTVQVVVHEAKVVQIETTEKVRLAKPERDDYPSPVNGPFR